MRVDLQAKVRADMLAHACTYVALDLEAEVFKPDEDLEEKYVLPDGNINSIRKECFRCRLGQTSKSPRRILCLAIS